MTDDFVPFSILTGFLGAGKTTVLNRVLSRPQGNRIAVLVNELGRIAIDSQLILSQGGDVLELAGGCVCCKVDVKNDLWYGIADVIQRSKPDHVILETTGIAEPAAILEGLDRLSDDLRDLIRVAGVICVVDADAGVATLERHDEARAQVETADRLLLSKLDIAPAARVEALHPALRTLNAGAESASFPPGEEGTLALVPWLLDRRNRNVSGPRHGHTHRHGQLVAASFVDDAGLLAEPLMALLERLGDSVVRAKGFVNIAGRSQRGFLEVAGRQTRLSFGDDWGTTPRKTELVLIGEELDESALRRQLWACRAAE